MPKRLHHHVLLVEDGDIDAELIMEEFRKMPSVKVHRVRDGDECMHHLRDVSASRPDVIFLDLKMPKKGGREVLAELRVDPDLHIVPVVVLSGSDNDDDVRTAYRLGASAYVPKPARRSDYESVMKSVIEFWAQHNESPPQ